MVGFHILITEITKIKLHHETIIDLGYLIQVSEVAHLVRIYEISLFFWREPCRQGKFFMKKTVFTR